MLDKFTAKAGVNATQDSVDVVVNRTPEVVVAKSPAVLTAKLVVVLLNSGCFPMTFSESAIYEFR